MLAARSNGTLCQIGQGLQNAVVVVVVLEHVALDGAAHLGSSSTARITVLTMSALGAVDWQRHAELRVPGAGDDLDGPLVLENDTPRDIEAEAGALPDRLRREERIEDALADLRGQSRPIVDDANDDGRTLAARCNGDVASGRVQRVVDQVRPHLVELAAEPL